MQTLDREVFEETGWTIRDPIVLGFLHLHHETPKPPAYPFLHPDVAQVIYMAEQVIYMAEADRFTPDTADPDGYEQGSAFRSFADVRALPLVMGQHGYLEQALRLRRERGIMQSNDGR